MNAIVKARVDSSLKTNAENVLKQMGMDMTVAIRMFLTQVVQRQALPFDVKIIQPNALTLQAIEDSYAGKVETFDSVEAMLTDANH
jgi:DNA-damage-inducible protein J